MEIPFLLYLSPYLSPYSILVTASSGGVYIYSCCSCCGCYKVAGAAIKVTGGTAIKITCSTAVKIAGGISKAASGIKISFIDLACCASCLGAVGVRGDISALKWDEACADKAYADKAYTDGA